MQVHSENLAVIKNLEVVYSPHLKELLLTFMYVDMDGQEISDSSIDLSAKVIEHPLISKAPLNVFKADTLVIEAENIFDELRIQCQFNQGSAIIEASIGEGLVKCELTPLEIGVHSLDVYSIGLARFLARDMTVNIHSQPELLSITPLWLATTRQNQLLWLTVSENLSNQELFTSDSFIMTLASEKSEIQADCRTISEQQLKCQLVEPFVEGGFYKVKSLTGFGSLILSPQALGVTVVHEPRLVTVSPQVIQRGF